LPEGLQHRRVVEDAYARDFRRLLRPYSRWPPRRSSSGGRRPSLKLQMDEILRFWAEVACENLQSSGANLTKRQLLAQILQQYERRGDAMRYLNANGNIAWKASPRFLMMLADAERDARDDLAEFP
jgi:hypothetical protein